ncbi:pyruvate kinase [Striga asiatica]|uniref:Pyruvate kinase n=1 Tax=Striga asiatica TaxID=4170 RepID=A0A5A7QEM7_STRAF|nr:pyruvate kinase [Striga asiatica]
MVKATLPPTATKSPSPQVKLVLAVAPGAVALGAFFLLFSNVGKMVFVLRKRVYIVKWQLSVQHLCASRLPAREDGSEAHEALASVSRLLLKETLTKFPGIPLLAFSPEDLFPIILEAGLLTSGISPFVEAFFTGACTLLTSLVNFREATLLSSFDVDLSLIDFLEVLRTWDLKSFFAPFNLGLSLPLESIFPSQLFLNALGPISNPCTILFLTKFPPGTFFPITLPPRTGLAFSLIFACCLTPFANFSNELVGDEGIDLEPPEKGFTFPTGSFFTSSNKAGLDSWDFDRVNTGGLFFFSEINTFSSLLELVLVPSSFLCADL